MLKLAYFFVSCGLVLGFSIAFEGHAYAYVDPGSGLFLLQGISSAFAGILFYFRKLLKLLIRRPKVIDSELQETE